MATRMGIRELRNSLTSTLRRVRAGESVEITHHGRPVAVLAPLPEGRLERLVATGEVAPGVPLAEPIPRMPPAGARTASEALEEDRAER